MLIPLVVITVIAGILVYQDWHRCSAVRRYRKGKY